MPIMTIAHRTRGRTGRRRRLPTMAFAATLAACSPAPPGSSAVPADSALAASLDAAVEALLRERAIPGASLAVAREGRIVHARGYGWADTVAGTRVGPEHRFRIASVSKPITAVAILELVDRGRLDLGDRAFELLGLSPASGGRPDPRIRDITVRHLLRHRAGFDRSRGLDPTLTPGGVARELGVEPPVDVDQIIAFMLDQDLDFDPGARAAYSNFGYAVLGRLIEEVTGQDYESWVRVEILGPVGAEGMSLGAAFPDERPAGEVAYHHPPPPDLVPAVPPREGLVRLPDGGFDLDVMAAHGGWTATASELVRVALAVDGAANPPDLLPAGLVDEMLAPPAGEAPDSAYYAMGWIVEPAPDGGDPSRWWHPGDLPCTTAVLAHSGSTTWAVLLNGSPWSRTAQAEIMDVVGGALLTPSGGTGPGPS